MSLLKLKPAMAANEQWRVMRLSYEKNLYEEGCRCVYTEGFLKREADQCKFNLQ